MGIIDAINKIEQGVVKIANKIKNGIKFFSSTIRNDYWFTCFSFSGSITCFGNGKNFRACVG